MSSSTQVATLEKCQGGDNRKAIKIGRLNWVELAGVSWSEFAVGSLRAQSPYVKGAIFSVIGISQRRNSL